MMISHFDFSSPFSLKDNFGYIVVENPTKFYEYCNDLFKQQNGDDGKFVFLDQTKELSFSKEGTIVFDCFSLSLQDKKIVNGLHSELIKIVGEKYQKEEIEITQKIIGLVDCLNVESDFPIEFNEIFSFADILKMLKVVPLNDFSSFTEKIVNYIELLGKFTSVKMIVFVNLRRFLTNDEMFQLLKHISYSSVSVLMLESTLPEFVWQEKTLVIDKDLCEILLNE